MKKQLHFPHGLTIAWSVAAILAASLSQGKAAGIDHSIFDALLKAHVVDGRVDYAALPSDPRLDQYLAQLAAAELGEEPSQDAKLALWINAYNAYTLKLVASAYPVESIRLIDEVGHAADSAEQGRPWKIRFAQIDGKRYSLDQIEHEIIRAQFDDARIHFAIVCAAHSCPILRSEAYTGANLDQQLEEQGRWFFAHRNEFDLASKQASLSKIIEWFADDFGGDKESVLGYAARYVDPKIATSLARRSDKWTIRYLDYDWSLNDQK